MESPHSQQQEVETQARNVCGDTGTEGVKEGTCPHQHEPPLQKFSLDDFAVVFEGAVPTMPPVLEPALVNTSVWICQCPVPVHLPVLKRKPDNISTRTSGHLQWVQERAQAACNNHERAHKLPCARAHTHSMKVRVRVLPGHVRVTHLPLALEAHATGPRVAAVPMFVP